jgi:hypothetical protein
MATPTLKRLTTPEDFAALRALPVGTRLAYCRNPYRIEDEDKPDFWWVTVAKVTPKSVSVDNPEGGYKDRTLTFRCQPLYTGAPAQIEQYGGEHWTSGGLFLVEDNTTVAAVDASYARRKAYQDAEAARRKANEDEAEARRQARHAAAVEANRAATWAWKQVGTVGTLAYWFNDQIVEEHGRKCAVVLAVKQVKEYSWRNDTTKLVWSAAVNYKEHEAYYDEEDNAPGTMASCSPNVTAETMEKLFEAVAAYIW